MVSVLSKPTARTRSQSTAKERTLQRYKSLVHQLAQGQAVNEEEFEEVQVRAGYTDEQGERHIATARERIEAVQAIADAKAQDANRNGLIAESKAIEAELIAAESDTNSTLGLIANLKAKAQEARGRVVAAKTSTAEHDALRTLNRSASKQFRERFNKASHAACTLESQRRDMFLTILDRCGIGTGNLSPPPDTDKVTSKLTEAVKDMEREVDRMSRHGQFKYEDRVVQSKVAALEAAQLELATWTDLLARHKKIVDVDLPAALEHKKTVEAELLGWDNFDW